MEAREGSVLDAIFEDDEQGLLETLDYDDEDVEMLDADAGVEGRSATQNVSADSEPAEGGVGSQLTSLNRSASNSKKKKKKKKNRKKRKRQGDSAPNITDINRFVMDTCRHLKEKKSYLVWNAVGCLGVSAVNDLVKEVDAIQGCGGQITADGSRFRNGGGILWNILKTREPKAFKDIMKKGREFEKQLFHPRKKQVTNRNEAAAPQTTRVPDEASGGEVLNNSEHIPEVHHGLDTSASNKDRVPVRERIRVPVSYDDLFEEGEIHE